MSIDVERLTTELVRGASMMVQAALAPMRAEIAQLRADSALMIERLAAVEARAPVAGPPGRDGVDGKDGAPGPQGEKGADGRDGKDGLAGRDGVDGKDGAPGPQGEKGADGRLPIVKAWTDEVHYAGDVVTSLGATWQAKIDTGHAPPHDDWTCLAAAGRDGRSLAVRGTFDPSVDYGALDIVALNGGSFVALTDDPGDCPGPGWQLLTAPGKRGQRGEDGQRGAPGERGPRGPAGAAPVSLEVDDQGLLTLTMDTGETICADFYPVLRAMS